MSEEKMMVPGDGETLKNVVNRAQPKTQTEVKFASHLQNMLKEEPEAESSGKKFGLTYGHSILALVVFEKYDEALDELGRVHEIGTDYPLFAAQAGRFIQHAKSLVRALKAKRAVGKLPHVSKAKQKELIAHLSAHFEDLRGCVKNIEKIERRVRKDDLSSTRYFLVVFYWCAFGLFISSMVLFAFPLYLYSIHQVITHTLGDFIVFLVNLV